MSAAISSSLFSLAPAQSLTQPRNLRILHSPTSLALPISPSLCLKSNRHPNLFACCSLNVQDSTAQDTPIEKRNVFLLFFCQFHNFLGLNMDLFLKKLIWVFTEYPAFPTVMDINQIREILPHRFPFLLVDRVIEYNPGVSAVAIKNVTINDNFFPGHFPERPIMPGVLMIEAMAQVGGIVMLQPEVGGSRDNFFFAGIDKVRFRKPVIAGDTLVMRMTLVKFQKRFGIAKMEGKAYVGGDLVCEGEFLMASGSV
ncbi:hypothetical protein DVH24_039340 [Malus domestica]|uniref:3-hydroxyacyl-[acyl-carrier-protein] dehydratase n=1 Tax=Malus domestica TaxID=3750 RepID=A0A498I2H6_MALDO|nr:hypothetical protein DVH24_039340 [Malus domestica]